MEERSTTTGVLSGLHWEWQPTLNPVTEPVDLFIWGLWRANHGKPRIAGADNDGTRKNRIRWRWLPDTNRVTDVVRVTFVSVLPSRSTTVLGSETLSNGSSPCCTRFALRNESSPPEAIRSVSGKVSFAHNNEPGRTMHDEDGQDEIVLLSTPACADELSVLAAQGSR